MRYSVVIATLFIWVLSGAGAEAYYLDAPHNESNGIVCATCHSSAPFYVTDWAARTAANPDDTLANAVCLMCHDPASTDPHKGPAMALHSSSTIPGATTWSTECIQCHDQHAQGQLDWNTTDGNRLFLATGSFRTIASIGGSPLVYTPGTSDAGYTTVGISPTIIGDPQWTDVTTWNSKGGNQPGGNAVDGSRGLILVPNKGNPNETFEIIDVTPTTINGRAGYLLKVKGEMAQDASQGGVFGVIYGAALRSSLMPNGGAADTDYRDVKFFQPWDTAGTHGGPADETPGATKPVGLCQVCHAQTLQWNDDGSGSEHGSDSGYDCLECHDPLAGFAAPPEMQPAQISFTADKTMPNPGETVLLTWSTQFSYDGAVNIVDNYNRKIVDNGPAAGSISVPVSDYGYNRTITFTATAAGDYGSSKPATLEINILDYPVPTIVFTAEPSQINLGGQAILNWQVTGADNVTVLPDGWTGKSASQTVAPISTTSYLLTASNPSHTATATVTVTINPPLPTVSFAVENSAILAGESTWLSWSATDADAVVRRETSSDGTWSAWSPVASSDSIEIAPEATTTYELKADNGAGSAGGTVTVTVLPRNATSIVITSPLNNATVTEPFVRVEGLAFDPSWEFEVLINGVQAAYQNGTSFHQDHFPLHAGANTITATVSGAGGSAQTSIVVNADIPPQAFAILQPKSGANLNEPYVMVEGQLAEGMAETGVVVNGIPAQVVGDHFTVNNLPLAAGENTITAVATGIDGATEEKSITVTVNSTSQEWIKLSLNPESGVADPGATPPKPFTTTLLVTPHLNTTFLAYYSLNWEYSGSASGPANVFVISDNADGTEHQLAFTAPGVYTLTYTLYTANWAPYQATIKVNVLDNGEIDTLLKAKWDSVKAAWTAHDVEGGLTYFAEKSKANYREALTALVAELPQIVSEMQDMELIYLRDRYAKYRIHRLQEIDGAMVNLTYYLYFVKDQTGLWKVDQF